MDPEQRRRKTGEVLDVITIKDSDDESDGEDVAVRRRSKKRIRTISFDDEDTLTSSDRSNPAPRSSIKTRAVSAPMDKFVQGPASASNVNASKVAPPRLDTTPKDKKKVYKPVPSSDRSNPRSSIPATAVSGALEFINMQGPSRLNRTPKEQKKVNKPVPSLDRFNSKSATSPKPHNKHGKLSSEINEQVALEALIDWLEELESQKRPQRDDKKRMELEKAANWRQKRRKNMIGIRFASRIPGSSVKGYYMIMISNNRAPVPQRLSSYYKSKMRSGNSATAANLNMSYRDPTHPLYETIKKSTEDSAKKRPPLDLVYVSSLFPPKEKLDSLMETIMAIEPVQSGTLEDYTGSSCGGKLGFFSQRHNHFTKKTNPSEIYKRTVGSSNPMMNVEKKVALMDSESTKEIVEGFLMTFGELHDKKHNCKRFIITKCAAPRMDDMIKAQKYVDDGTPMFRALKKGEIPWPPPFATVEEATTLPWTVDETDLIVRFDPANPTKKQHYKSFQNMEQLVAEFGDPPPSYFMTMKDSRAEFKAQFEALKAKRL